MTDALKLSFGPFTAPAKGVLVAFCDGALKFGPATRMALGPAAAVVARAANSERFTGKKTRRWNWSSPKGSKPCGSS
jgi:leucyl aminopeptidase